MDVTTGSPQGSLEAASQSQALHRELKVTDAAAFSVGLIGPVGAMALLGVGAAGILGRAAIWAFLFALLGVALVAYSFVRLSRHIAHSGSVYALVGVTLGPRAGFVAGWALLAAYVTIGAGSAIEIGLFAGDFLQGVGLVHSLPWVTAALLALALAAMLGYTEIRVITRSLLFTEILGAIMVTGLSVIVLVRLTVGHGPTGQTFDTHFLQLPHGTGFGTIASAAVFGFLAFAGFEGAAALGEETQNPRHEIPRAIKIALSVVGAFYLLTITAQSLGYGTDPASVKAFQNAQSPYGELAKLYVGSGFADVLNLVASISLFAILLGTVTASARILFALARGAGATRGLARLSRDGEPTVALAIVLLFSLGIIVGQYIAGTSVLSATFYWLTIGTLALLVAYGLATVGAIKFLFFGLTRRAPRWQIVVPVAGLALVGYTLYRNVVGVAAPYDKFPYLVGGWILIALAVVVLSPRIAKRIGIGLARALDDSQVAAHGVDKESTG